jgi:hypothetical protein
MVIFSIIFLTLISYFKFNTLRNPAFYFIIIHYLHNFSFSVLKNNGLDIFWRADPSVDFSTMDTIVSFNLVCLWLTSLLLIFFIKKKDNFITIKNSLRKNKFSLFIYILFSLIIIYNNRGLVSGNIVYGFGQALDSVSSFDPLARLWNFRVYFILFYIIFNKPAKKTILFIVLFEFMMSFLLSERKDLTLILFGLLIVFFNRKKVRFNFFQIFSSIIIFLSLIILPIYRSFINENGIINKLYLTLDFIKDSSELILYYGTGFVNSEGVQNWTFQLINDGSLNLLYGLSYLQGFINIIIFRPFQPDWLANSQAAYYFKDIAYPSVTNHGYDFSFTAEAILNFGINGGYISYLLLSLYIINLYKKKSKTWIFQRMLIWPILLISFRTDSTSMFRLVSYVFFTPIIINLIYSFKNVWNRRIT